MALEDEKVKIGHAASLIRICSAGAGSGRTPLLSQPPKSKHLIEFRRDRRAAPEFR
jgi:hypothetical protein